jgi:hypothetical protein
MGRGGWGGLGGGAGVDWEGGQGRGVGLGEACSVSFFPGQRRVTLLVFTKIVSGFSLRWLGISK